MYTDFTEEEKSRMEEIGDMAFELGEHCNLKDEPSEEVTNFILSNILGQLQMITYYLSKLAEK